MSVKEFSNKEDEIEIRLYDVLKFLKGSYKYVIRGIIIFFIIGTLYAFSKHNEYTAEVKVMPELKTSAGAGGLGDLKSLAGLAGINFDNLGGASEAIRPDLYPNIVQSIPFCLYLLRQPTTTTDMHNSQTLQNYLVTQDENIIINFYKKILSNDVNEPTLSINKTTVPTLQLTRKQEELTKNINERINANIDKKSGIITITCQMPDAIVAATAAQQTLDYITTYVTNYRTNKSRKQANFLARQVENSRKRYELAELNLSRYRDQNRNLFLSTAKIEEQRLQSDYTLAQTVYNDLSKQLEQARIKVQDEAPIFQILEPAQVPLRKSGPKRLIIIAGFSIFGLIFGLITFFIRQLAKR
jgi:uncharacterized protein involved in exopolysaccharide biosynthesis